MSCKDIKPPCKPSHARYIQPFWGFTEFTPTIPKLYWNVKSQEQRILRICDMLERLICYSDYLGDKVEINKEDIEALKSEFEEFKEHGFEEYYLEQIEQWVNDNMPQIIGYAMRMVFFGCTEDGHFTAYIPESWKPIIFNYGADYSDKNTYGHLILEMFVTDTYQYNDRPTNLIWEVAQ